MFDQFSFMRLHINLYFLSKLSPEQFWRFRGGAVATLHTFYGKHVVHGDFAYMHRGCEMASGELAYMFSKANGPWRLCIVASL